MYSIGSGAQLSILALQEWIADKKDDNWHAYVKRLSANDTGLTGGHGAGIYIPEDFTRLAFPSILRCDELNPSHVFHGQVDSHSLPAQELRIIYYNSKKAEKRKNGRNEQRITRWKQGVIYAPLQDPENTGALTLITFQSSGSGTDTPLIQIWVCTSIEEESYLEGMIGDVLPTATIFQPLDSLIGGGISTDPGHTESINIPEAWNDTFPTGTQISDYVAKTYPFTNLAPDRRLVERYLAEYQVFRKVEDSHVLPLVSRGFECVQSFISLANSISNRRKSRAGRSLELHLERIFKEEGLTQFETQAKTEGNKKPDFLFPSASCYLDDSFPEKNLNMLAVKTTLKDRWRQVISEANRIPVKYLFTLQEGISENQFQELSDAGIRLVVPANIRKKFLKTLQPEILDLREFINRMKTLQLDQDSTNSSTCS